MLPGAGVEISASGTGLHVFGKGICPPHGCRNTGLNLELYTERRFVALTGNGAIGDANTDNTIQLPGLVSYYFPLSSASVNPKVWTTEPHGDWNGPKDDAKLIEKMLASKSTASKFGQAATFADLWNRNVEVLTEIYTPDDSSSDEFNGSIADAALAQHLAFWTGNNCERMQALMNQSGLKRDKWEWHKTYLKDTIENAVSKQDTFYSNKRKEPPRISVEASPLAETMTEPTQVTGYQFLGLEEQKEHFKGCVYVSNLHKAFTPKGEYLKPEQFNVIYGGYVFQLESEATGKTTTKAWEAFTISQAIRYPTVEATCFRPELQPRSFVEDDGRRLVNTYVPIITRRLTGDPSRFLTHLEKVLPEQQDRDILLAYMAACVQYKGVKFQWSPLIQGIEGNGKTLFTRCVAFAIGDRYTHLPRASEIAEKYNAWLFNTLFIGVEDIYVPDHKLEVIEILKPMITSDRLERREMQANKDMGDCRCNFIFNSNHKDAVKKTMRDRRFAVMYTAQQNDGDIERDGMHSDYFPKLYALYKADGYAIVNEFLTTYQIPVALNPAGELHRAPVTTSTAEAVSFSLGGVEQEMEEAIKEGRTGFANGWVSSIALATLLKNMRADKMIPINKRGEILNSMGYHHHPHLPDGAKPRLFIKMNHLALQLTTPTEIQKAYEDAQTMPSSMTRAGQAFNRL